MQTNEFLELGMESFFQDMADISAKCQAATYLQNKMRYSRGVNQSLAMECEAMRPGFITTANPLGSFSVQPSKTNYTLALEEMDKVQMGLIGAAIAIGAAILWKIIKWFRNWFNGGSSDNSSSGSGGSDGGSSSSSSGCVTPDRANKIITNGIDVLAAIDDIKKELTTAAMPPKGLFTRGEVETILKDITTKTYERLGNSITELTDELINGSGAVKNLLLLHEHHLKEAPTKLRDAFNKLEQMVTAYHSSSTDEAQEAELAKMTEMYEQNKDKKSFWFPMPEDSTPDAKLSDQTAKLKTSFIEASGTKSKLGTELVANPNGGFITKLRQGVHSTYEKLLADVQRLTDEIETDLQSKITSLEKQAGTHLIPKNVDPTTLGDFAKVFKQIIDLLNNDIAAIKDFIFMTGIVCSKYGRTIENITASNAECIKELIKFAEKVKATEVKTALNKLKTTNDKLINGILAKDKLLKSTSD